MGYTITWLEGYGYCYIPPRFCEKKAEKREFHEVFLRETRGRPLTQRHSPTTLQEADDSSCDAKVQFFWVG
jgi:hypothetical protein